MPSRLCAALLLLPFLANSAPPDARQVRELVKQLDDDEFDTRERAEATLRKLGKEAVPQLDKELAAAKSEEVRRRLERVILAISPLDTKVRQIIPRLGDDDYTTRERATADLVALGKGALPFLRRELANNRNDEETRKRLARAIGQLER
jgi:HEAT repeat protein